MKNPIVIFGMMDYAQLAHYYLTKDSNYDVVAFTVNEQYLPEDRKYLGLPVVPFEEIEAHYSPDDYLFFSPMSPKNMNRLREKVYLEAKERGYRFGNYISSKASVFDNEIGENCFILEDNTLQPFTKIGNNVVLWSGNHIGHHGEIKDHVTFTSHIVMSGHCVIEPNCFLGVNATLRDGITLAEGTLVAMAASITKNTEPWGVYMGNPATKKEKPSYELM